MTRVVLILSCGHWTKGDQGLVDTFIRCEQCKRRLTGASDSRAKVIGECSPHQMAQAS